MIGDRRNLDKKFEYLRKEKRSWMEQKAEDINAQRVKEAKERCHKKIVYDLTNEKKLTQKEIELLSLGLNFGIAPKTFDGILHCCGKQWMIRRLYKRQRQSKIWH